MSEEKKTFFASLTPKSALTVGLVAGVLTLGTIGFIILATTAYTSGVGCGVKSTKIAANPAVAQGDQTPTPSVVKSDKPVVELFIMTYCPYGLQMQKAFNPVWSLLKDKADFSVKFVSYAMHGLKEVEENTRQYCIETEQADKYLAYASCFDTSGDYKACLTTASVNSGKLDSCVAATNKKFGIMDKYNDKSSWLSGQFPIYPIHQDLNDEYGVQGSPTLVINGAQVEVGRSPEAVKAAVCAAFNNAPSECQQKLSTDSAAPSFGAGTASGNTAGAACGN